MFIYYGLISLFSLLISATPIGQLDARQTSSNQISLVAATNSIKASNGTAKFTTLDAASCSSLSPSYPSSFWYEEIEHNGLSSFLDESYGTYNVFRNVVTDFGADNTGNSDASKAIQNAILGETNPGMSQDPVLT